ncbi:hypothetical protein [Paenibacillus sp. CECT 9249]|uniref:hypothetical protein n=2 Tax=unclassified Paenibacillus TaxID=185978 RepID=UPI001E640F5A|nr:hypothetical protein [Paenibacillus sp. CECT 9249]
MVTEMDHYTQVDSCGTQGLESNTLLTLDEKELKREELIGVLAGLIKNYAMKQPQK